VILLDTDICVELLKGNKRVVQRRAEYDGPVGVCFMTIAELYYGAQRSKEPAKNRDLVEKLLLSLEIIQTDIEILRRFGSIKSTLMIEGTPIRDADILIASATLERAEKLVTGNRKHFERISGLGLEDWS